MDYRGGTGRIEVYREKGAEGNGWNALIHGNELINEHTELTDRQWKDEQLEEWNINRKKKGMKEWMNKSMNKYFLLLILFALFLNCINVGQ